MDSYEFRYERDGFATQRRYPNEALIRFLATHYFHRTDRKDIKILEVGMGAGANLWVIAREGFDAYGIDYAPSAIPLCEKMLESYGTKATLAVGDMQNLPYEDNTFDAIVDVVATIALDLEGTRKALKEIYRCLKPDGRFFSWHYGANSDSFTKGGAEVIDECTIGTIVNEGMVLRNVAGTSSFFTPPKARELLTEAGFTDIKIDRVNRTYDNESTVFEHLEIEAQKMVK
jgi:ubiquinone/menaquinone biosynthesis C-methylase UbiE